MACWGNVLACALACALAFEARQDSFDRAQESRILGVLVSVGPGVDVEAGVTGEVLAVPGTVSVVRRVPIESTGPLVGYLMVPQTQGKPPGWLGSQLEAPVP